MNEKTQQHYRAAGSIREWIGSGVEAVTVSVSDRVMTPDQPNILATGVLRSTRINSKNILLDFIGV